MKLNDPRLFRQACQVADGWPLSRFCDQNDVITQIIDTEFGLGSYLCARDLSRLFRGVDALQHGMVGANAGPISTQRLGAPCLPQMQYEATPHVRTS